MKIKNLTVTAFILLFLLVTIPLISLFGTRSPSEGSNSGTAVNAAVNGKFKLLDKSSNKVIQVSDREFIIGAVGSEMPPSFHTEALKAQAVASYTYAVRQRLLQEKSPSEELMGAHLAVNTEKYEVYTTKSGMKKRFGNSFETYYNKLERIADEVLGVVMTYQNQPIVAAYHSMSAGKTEAAENVWGEKVAYLTAVDSEGDTYASGYQTTVTKTMDEVRTILTAKYSDIWIPDDPEQWFSDAKLSPSNTVLSMMVGDITITGQELRALFGLRSACFTVEVKDDNNFVFTIKGYGHGVGLSQYGADFMARQGSSYQDILKHYYQGVEIGLMVK